VAGPDATRVSRRKLLQAGALLGTGAVLRGGAPYPLRLVAQAASTKPAGSDLGAVEHVVFLMQENRSFDHYFGSYRGVRGFDDHTEHSYGAFAQPYPANESDRPTGVVLPYHMDTTTSMSECTEDLSHTWGAEHKCWNGGRMDSFVKVHTSPEYEGPAAGLHTMGYYTRSDIPYYYALADAFTICDAYHCSVMGPTHPNRLMSVSATIDPAGDHGGPILVTDSSPGAMWSVVWTTMPEVLEDAGISWKAYSSPEASPAYSGAAGFAWGDSVFPYFKSYKSPTSPLYQKAFLPTYPEEFVADVQSGELPAVSWIISETGYDEHPPSAASWGEYFTSMAIRALSSNPEVWAKTVLFIMYDENDGWFDHVPPPVPPRGTSGEYVTKHPLPADAEGIDGPIGLGVRVPMLVVSPFSRGGIVATQTFDHTSQLRFLETRFGVEVPNLSGWRRAVTGDLTSALHMGNAEMSIPALPTTSDKPLVVEQECTPVEDYQVAGGNNPMPTSPQHMPRQE